MFILKDLLGQFIPDAHLWKLQLLSKWNSIVGDFKTTITLEKIHEDSLVLGVENSSWMQELYLLEPMLVATINAHLDQKYIKSIRFKLIARKKLVPTPIHQEKKQKHDSCIKISLQEQQALSKIEDNYLRKALENFLLRCYREK
jgi:hypothetical protein